MLYTGSDSMHVTLIENDKAVKSMKRGLRKVGWKVLLLEAALLVSA